MSSEFIINHDIQLDIATGRSRESISWKNEQVLWSKLVHRLSETHRTIETVGEYHGMKKADQDRIKDIGGFVGGYLAGGRRGKNTVSHRQLITLDLDFATPGVWGDITFLYSSAMLVYSTHKHTADHPRLRLLVPVDRELFRDEYEAVARRIAGDIGIEYFDPTTFQPERLMYWPSTPKDGEYVFEFQDGEILKADSILSKYRDWKDISSWPISSKVEPLFRNNMNKQGDPLEKKGLVGAFCRTYTITEVIDTYLSDIYEACETGHRYTYVPGSTAAGVVIYDDKFAHSHHSTDPAGGKLCNAFDLVRYHKYGDLDTGAAKDTPVNKLPSFEAMKEFVKQDKQVVQLISLERLQEARDTFKDYYTEIDEEGSLDKEEAEEDDYEWLKSLQVDSNGNVTNTSTNMVLILENDPMLKGAMAFNEFSKRESILRNLPWRKKKGETELNDTDLSFLRDWIQKHYKIISKSALEDAINIVCHNRRFHPVKQYLDGLVWDEKPRIATMLTEYMGAEQSDYTATVWRKFLTAAVARIYEPGIKFDHMPVLVGLEGMGKSFLAKALGGPWFSDSLYTVQGKDAFEQLQGSWIIEVAELAGFNKAEENTVKFFVSKQVDRFRVAFGRRSQDFPRQCVFMGTGNKKDFLKQAYGNRKFWPVEILVVPKIKSVQRDFTEAERAQVWAEAVQYYRNGETLYLDETMEASARMKQESHTETDHRAGSVSNFLDTLRPPGWGSMGMATRKSWLESEMSGESELTHTKGEYPINEICVLEIWNECLGGTTKDFNLSKSRDVHAVMRSIPGWEEGPGRMQFHLYGIQKYYRRINRIEKQEDDFNW